MRRTSSCSVPRVSASSAENGSSINRIFGSIESARAMPTRCFMPPESSAGRLCSAPVRPTRSMNLCDCRSTSALPWLRHFDDTAYATLPITERHGSSAWLWQITARSRLGPSIDWLSTITVPSEGTSRPARILSTVVLPQPEWPMMQTNSPRAIASHRSSNTVVVPPAGAGKRLVIPSMEMNLSALARPLVIALLRERHEPRGAREDLVEHHPDQPDHHYRRNHIGDR